MQAKWESESRGIFGFGLGFGFCFGFWYLTIIQSLNGNPNTRQHFVDCVVRVVSGWWCWLGRWFRSSFFFGIFSLCSILMKCMRWRLSAGIFSAKVLWTFLATRLAYIINNCTRGALSRLMSTHLMAYEGLVLTPGALTFSGFFG